MNKFTPWGAVTGGGGGVVQCHVAILGNNNVALSNLRNVNVTLSNLRNLHVPYVTIF